MTTTMTARPGSRYPVAPAGTGLRSGPLPRCPRCATALDGGPVAYRCARCGRGVMAADLNPEYHAPAPPRAATTNGGPP